MVLPVLALDLFSFREVSLVRDRVEVFKDLFGEYHLVVRARESSELLVMKLGGMTIMSRR
jgi:hypothetical protein